MLKFHPHSSASRTRPLLAVGLMAAAMCFAGGVAGAVDESTEAETSDTPGGEDDVIDNLPETSQDDGTATGTGTTAKPSQKVSTETVASATVHTALFEVTKKYDQTKAQAQNYMCDMADLIAKDNIGRPMIVKTLMEARGVTLETAATTAGRLIKLAKSPETIQGLRDGSLNIRETVYGKKPAKGATAATGDTTGGETAGGGKATGKSDTEKQEDKYNRTMKEFVTCAKASGYDRASIVSSVTAALKDAGVK